MFFFFRVILIFFAFRKFQAQQALQVQQLHMHLQQAHQKSLQATMQRGGGDEGASSSTSSSSSSSSSSSALADNGQIVPPMAAFQQMWQYQQAAPFGADPMAMASSVASNLHSSHDLSRTLKSPFCLLYTSSLDIALCISVSRVHSLSPSLYHSLSLSLNPSRSLSLSLSLSRLFSLSLNQTSCFLP